MIRIEHGCKLRGAEAYYHVGTIRDVGTVELRPLTYVYGYCKLGTQRVVRSSFYSDDAEVSASGRCRELS